MAPSRFPVGVAVTLLLSALAGAGIGHLLSKGPQSSFNWAPRAEGEIRISDARAGSTKADGSEEDPRGRRLREGSYLVNRRHSNQAGSYSFRYPAGWELSDEGSVSQVSGPDRAVVFSTGVGSAGDLSVAYDEFVAILTQKYRDVWLKNIEQRERRGNLSLRLAGTGINHAGIPFDFVASIVDPRGTRKPVVAFGAWGSRFGDLEAPAREMVRSLRV